VLQPLAAVVEPTASSSLLLAPLLKTRTQTCGLSPLPSLSRATTTTTCLSRPQIKRPAQMRLAAPS
jgi:hypothetical protein